MDTRVRDERSQRRFLEAQAAGHERTPDARPSNPGAYTSSRTEGCIIFSLTMSTLMVLLACIPIN